jgi:glycosyltransferase involved in cell wall biosynthesis
MARGDERVGRVLLTVSGVIEADLQQRIEAGLRPRPDYVELARAMDADVVDVAEARRRAGWIGRVLERLGGAGPLLAWVCFRERRRYEAIFTDGEHVGLLLATLCRLTARRPFAHVMIVHIMSVPKKSMLFRVLRLGRYVDTMVVYASAQRTYVMDTLGVPDERVLLTPFTVDTEFFAPARVTPAVDDKVVISTAGLEYRDYPTLVEAARDVDARVVVAAASPWSKRPDETLKMAPPPNVEVCRLGFDDLRQLYADSRFVVMPLYENDFQAGVTTLLEAMAMGRAVICSRTRGQTDVVADGVTGVYVPPGDSAAMRSAVQDLLDDPDRCARLGAAGRRFVVEQCDVVPYARRLASAVDAAIRRNS